MQTTNTTTVPVSLAAAINSRIYSWITNASFMQFLLVFYKIIWVIMVTGFFFAPEASAEIIGRNDGVILKWFIGINCIMFLDIVLVRVGRAWIPSVSFSEEEGDHVSWPLDGPVMLSDVIDFVLQHDGFPIAKARELFGLNVPKLKDIGDALEDVGVLVRGPNNARLVAPGIDRSSILAIIEQHDVPVDQFGSSFVQTASGSYKSLASALVS